MARLALAPDVKTHPTGLVIGGAEWNAGVARAAEWNAYEEQAMREGKAFLSGQPSLDDEAWDWVGRFERAGAKIIFSHFAGFGQKPGGSIGYHIPPKAEDEAFALLKWLGPAGERQPGIKRRVVELALGFDVMLAERRA